MKQHMVRLEGKALAVAKELSKITAACQSRINEINMHHQKVLDDLQEEYHEECHGGWKLLHEITGIPDEGVWHLDFEYEDLGIIVLKSLAEEIPEVFH